MAITVEELQNGLARAFREFLHLYSEQGGHRFPGFVAITSDHNYQGPLIWSEGDAQFRLALALESEFPGMVHIEVPQAKFIRDVFAARPHGLFVEVKYFGHSSTPGPSPRSGRARQKRC